MDSRTFTIQQVFQDRRQYRVPFYQRPYVWNREDQWGRLWEDVREKAEARLTEDRIVPHFMGAVVLEPQRKTGLLGVEQHHIIDGQQRLTTMQYVLTALTLALREWEQPTYLPIVEACLQNANPETMQDREVEAFKLWPTFRDREQYVSAMTAGSMDELRERFPASFTQRGDIRKIGIDHPPALEAIAFFRGMMIEWAGEQTGTPIDAIATSLATAVLTDLSIVCISLGEEDDAQVIFETLNGHGAELHATDLIRNFIFMRAGANADDLYTSLWSQFEAPLWSAPQTRGRLTRPRLEWFVQTAVQAQTGEEIDIGRLYAGYRRFVDSSARFRAADAQLDILNASAEHYRALVTGTGETPIGVFGRRIAAWDASPTHALALKIAQSSLAEHEQREIFDSIESYIVRRAICGLTRKNYNKTFAQLLKKVQSGELSAQSFRALLSEGTSDIARWPRDEEFYRHWLTGEIYPGRLDAAKLRVLFHRLETALRSEKSEERVPLALDTLDIDHILPQSWYAHWPLADETSVTAAEASEARILQYAPDNLDDRAQAIVDREQALLRIGNLTFVHYGVNRSVQNRAFDEKRQAFFAHSNLQLNRGLMQATEWDEASIARRGEELFDVARKLWASPAQ
ncbi:DUF262 domain-containing protein [Burkholderia vietnamiensis]|uniref:DUF262 domain-containing HNH endonuclease family protein n=1 Tax=Burkholderia vietnamiensis TaxID=60552 RepID=A0AAW7T5G3_BURVI|nr:DUF262 domain-containing HNH endonuclease family protein [Burkholderia vietnamiensis]MDN7797258.1 DUF262 domain-containing HNH endonuclease family protein [Burkholderia vietnamiensis]HDR9192144.1 DUF262 domain-containing protein [Burkholderia vietnamiensis]